MGDSILTKIQRGEIPTDFNWNHDRNVGAPLRIKLPIEPTPDQISRLELVAEDLRDGLHGINHYPSETEMKHYIDNLAVFGFRYMTVGIFTGLTSNIDHTIKNLLSYIKLKYPGVTPILVSLTSENSLRWINECKNFNPNLEVLVFMGSSPTRILVEEWSKKRVLNDLSRAIKTIVHDFGLKALATPEQATQTPPSFLRQVIKASVDNGAQRICIADTIGIARPIGAVWIINFFRKILKSINAANIPLDWHGHDDLGNGHYNAVAAVAAGATRIHTVARGVGERAGNTKLESLILNLYEITKEAGLSLKWDLSKLHNLLTTYDKLTNLPPPSHGPLSQRAFKTSLGIHTAAILKAEKVSAMAEKNKLYNLAKKLKIMSHRIYCPIDAHVIGRDMEILVGPWSGKSTVELALHKIGMDRKNITDELIIKIINMAKEKGRELEESELLKFKR